MLEDISTKFSAREIDSLFKADALIVGRKLLGNNTKMVQNGQRILSSINDNKLKIIYRHMDTYIQNIDNEVINVYKYMNEFVNNNDNRFKIKLNKGQFLFIDNTSIIHGRTPYILNENEKRILYRVNYYNNGPLSRFFSLGIPNNFLYNFK